MNSTMGIDMKKFLIMMSIETSTLLNMIEVNQVILSMIKAHHLIKQKFHNPKMKIGKNK
jgi:hypothetical protein